MALQSWEVTAALTRDRMISNREKDIEIRKTEQLKRNAARTQAREFCRMSSSENLRTALRMAEFGYGWEDVRGGDINPRCAADMARLLVLGIS